MGDVMVCGGIAVCLAPIAACNAILGIDDVTPVMPGTSVPDARIEAVRCDVAANLTLISATPSTSLLTHHMTGGGVSLAFLLDSSARPDELAMDLYDGTGGHGVVNAVGSYGITASDAALASCGICVGVYTDLDASARTFSQAYFAVSQGTLKLDVFDATGISGSLKGVRLRQVDLSGGSMRDVVGGCTVTIGDAEFTATWSSAVAPAVAGSGVSAVPP